MGTKAFHTKSPKIQKDPREIPGIHPSHSDSFPSPAEDLTAALQHCLQLTGSPKQGPGTCSNSEGRTHWPSSHQAPRSGTDPLQPRPEALHVSNCSQQVRLSVTACPSQTHSMLNVSQGWGMGQTMTSLEGVCVCGVGGCGSTGMLQFWDLKGGTCGTGFWDILEDRILGRNV